MVTNQFPEVGEGSMLSSNYEDIVGTLAWDLEETREAQQFAGIILRRCPEQVEADKNMYNLWAAKMPPLGMERQVCSTLPLTFRAHLVHLYTHPPS